MNQLRKYFDFFLLLKLSLQLDLYYNKIVLSLIKIKLCEKIGHFELSTDALSFYFQTES